MPSLFTVSPRDTITGSTFLPGFTVNAGQGPVSLTTA